MLELTALALYALKVKLAVERCHKLLPKLLPQRVERALRDLLGACPDCLVLFKGRRQARVEHALELIALGLLAPHERIAKRFRRLVGIVQAMALGHRAREDREAPKKRAGGPQPL